MAMDLPEPTDCPNSAADTRNARAATAGVEGRGGRNPLRRVTIGVGLLVPLCALLVGALALAPSLGFTVPSGSLAQSGISEPSPAPWRADADGAAGLGPSAVPELTAEETHGRADGSAPVTVVASNPCQGTSPAPATVKARVSSPEMVSAPAAVKARVSSPEMVPAPAIDALLASWPASAPR